MTILRAAVDSGKLRLAIVDKVDHTTGFCNITYLDDNAAYPYPIPIYSPYFGGSGWGIFVGMEKGTVVVVGCRAALQPVIVATVQNFKYYKEFIDMYVQGKHPNPTIESTLKALSLEEQKKIGLDQASVSKRNIPYYPAMSEGDIVLASRGKQNPTAAGGALLRLDDFGGFFLGNANYTCGLEMINDPHQFALDTSVSGMGRSMTLHGVNAGVKSEGVFMSMGPVKRLTKVAGPGGVPQDKAIAINRATAQAGIQNGVTTSSSMSSGTLTEWKLRVLEDGSTGILAPAPTTEAQELLYRKNYIAEITIGTLVDKNGQLVLTDQAPVVPGANHLSDASGSKVIAREYPTSDGSKGPLIQGTEIAIQIKTRAGAVINIDKSGNLSLSCKDADMNFSGNVRQVVEGSVWQTVMGKVDTYAKQGAKVTVDSGNLIATVKKGNLTGVVNDGDIDVKTVAGKLTLGASEDIVLQAGKKIQLIGKALEFEAQGATTSYEGGAVTTKAQQYAVEQAASIKFQGREVSLSATELSLLGAKTKFGNTGSTLECQASTFAINSNKVVIQASALELEGLGKTVLTTPSLTIDSPAVFLPGQAIVNAPASKIIFRSLEAAQASIGTLAVLASGTIPTITGTTLTCEAINGGTLTGNNVVATAGEFTVVTATTYVGL